MFYYKIGLFEFVNDWLGFVLFFIFNVMFYDLRMYSIYIIFVIGKFLCFDKIVIIILKFGV